MSLTLDGTAGISTTGNIVGNNVVVTGSFSPTILSVSGNIQGGNLLTNGLISATGNVTGNYLLGNGTFITGLSASKIFNGTSEANIGTSGGNANITIGGISNVVVVSTAGLSVSGTVQASGNITGGNILYGAGVVSGTGTVYAATVNAATIGNASAVHNGATVSATGNVTGGNVIVSGVLVSTNTISASGNITGGNISIGSGSSTAGSYSASGNISASYFIGNGYTLTSINGANVTGLNTAAISNGTSNVTISTSGGNITASVGGTPNVVVTTTTGISVSGTIQASANITGGNILYGAGVVSGTGTIYSATVNAATIGNASASLIGATVSATGNVTGGNVIVSGVLVSTNTISATGNVTGGNLSVSTGTITVGNIVNANGNAVGNIGSSSLYFNTVFAKATSAQYADLAEVYTADTTYLPGTVVSFGGTHEITISSISHNTQVAGIVSTQPAYLMNSTLSGEHTAEVALTGRVPCKVTGTIHKGDRLVASGIAGVAGPLDTAQYQPGCIIGKALEEWNSVEIGTIEVVVGKT